MLPATTVGVLLLVFFVIWELRTSHPMIDFGLFRIRTLSGGTLALAIPYFALPAQALFLSQYLQFVLGASALRQGSSSLRPRLASSRARSPLPG